MVSIKNSYPAFLMSLLLAQGVQADPAPGTFGLTTCDNTGGDGNAYRTYEILCDKSYDSATTTSTDLSSTIAKSGATFTTLCGLLEKGPFVTTSGTIDILKYIGEGVNRHTFFAPTDAAFNKNQLLVDELAKLALQTDAASVAAYDTVVSAILQLHMLPDTYLLENLHCDGVYESLNLSGLSASMQYSKTKCRGPVSSPTQIGGGNTMQSEQPAIGSPVNVFAETAFTAAVTGTTFSYPATTTGLFAANVVGCNGVIHVVDNLLISGNMAFTPDGEDGTTGSTTKSGKTGKATKSAKTKKAGRRLVVAEQQEPTEASRGESLERRRARLEALLEPTGDVQLN
eukprot:jgi/Psemu1/289316/fgenesh1_pg.347_\